MSVTEMDIPGFLGVLLCVIAFAGAMILAVQEAERIAERRNRRENRR